MSSGKNDFSVRGFLRERKALLVHFSTCMSRHESEYLFPMDLENARTLVDKPLSFSTITENDVGPFSVDGLPQAGNAAGSIGIVVDVQDGSVMTVGASDDGTFFNDETHEWISGGSHPSAETCAASIDDRADTNEWFVRNYTCIGIFYFEPAYARAKASVPMMGGFEEVVADRAVTLSEVLQLFPNDRIFTARESAFWEFNRQQLKWHRVAYDDIVKP
jgi:hypothetical protein